MTTCPRSDLGSPASATHRDARDLPSLRLLDITLACTLLAALALPLALARALGRVQRQPVQGRAGTPVDRLALVLPDSLAGRMLAACGAAQWPVLLNILSTTWAALHAAGNRMLHRPDRKWGKVLGSL